MFRKFMSRKVLALFMLVLLAVGSVATPAYAANGKARITIHDETYNVTLCQQSDPSDCNNLVFAANRTISFTLSEQQGATFHSGALIGADTNAIWTQRGYGLNWTGTGATPVCTYTDTITRWGVTCTSADDNIIWVKLVGYTDSTTDGRGKGSIMKTGYTNSLIEFLGYSTP